MQQICVGALLLQDREVPYILLGKRAANRLSYSNVWDVPGGHSEAGETPEQALVRELQEEIGITPTRWYFLTKLRVPDRGCYEPLILHLFAVTAWIGTAHNRQHEEHAEIAWFTIEDACSLPLAHPDYAVYFRRFVAVSASLLDDGTVQ